MSSALDLISQITATVEPGQKRGVDVYVWLSGGSSNAKLIAFVNSDSYQRNWPGSQCVSEKSGRSYHVHAPRRFSDGVAHYFDVVTVNFTTPSDLARAILALATVSNVAGFCNDDEADDNWIAKNNRAQITKLARELASSDSYRL